MTDYSAVMTYGAPFASGVLRALTLAGRFVLILALAQFLSPTEVGIFGLLLVTTNYMILVVGLDFYTYSNRFLLQAPLSRWPSVVRDQFVFHGIVYAVLIPPALVLWLWDRFPSEALLWVPALAAVDHISRELTRILVVSGRAALASLVTFIQKGTWAWVVVVLMVVTDAAHDLSVVVAAWLVGGLLSILVALASLQRLDWQAPRGPVDWSWIRKGIAVGWKFLAGTLCLQAIFTLDRYILSVSGGLDIVGVYTLYVGIAMGIIGFLEAAVYSFRYPRVVSAYDSNDQREFRLAMVHLRRQTGLATVALTGGIALVAHVAIPHLANPIYTSNLPYFYAIMVSIAVYAYSMVPHYGLYAMSRDTSLVRSHVWALIVFIIVSSIGSYLHPFAGVTVGLLTSTVVLCAMKHWSFHKAMRRLRWST